MELVSTMEISGEEREIADAVARGQIATNAQNIAANTEGIAGLNSNLDTLEYSDVAGGKNLLNNKSDSIPSHTGISAVVNDDKSITINGTATNHIYIGIYGSFILENGKTYNVIGCPSGGSAWKNTLDEGGTYNIYVDGYEGNPDIGNGNVITPSNTDSSFVIIWICKGYTCNNLVFKPMITTDLSLSYDDYEPYIPSVKMLAEEVSAQNESLVGIINSLPANIISGSGNVSGMSYSNGTITSNSTDTRAFCLHLFLGTSSNSQAVEIYGRDYFKKGKFKLKFKPTSNYTILRVKHNGATIDLYADLKVELVANKEYIITFNCVNNDTSTSGGLVISDIVVCCADFGEEIPKYVPYTGTSGRLNEDVSKLKNDLSDCHKKSDITTNETLIGTFNGKNYYRRLFTGIGASGSSVTVNVGEKIEIYNYYGRAYVYGQSGASAAKYPIPNKNYYIDSQNISETSFQLTIPTSSDTRKVDLVIEYTKVDE